jgi:hypothetical protein
LRLPYLRLLPVRRHRLRVKRRWSRMRRHRLWLHLPSQGPPHLRLLHLRLPHLRLPHLRLPHLRLPHLRLPHLRLPHLRLP